MRRILIIISVTLSLAAFAQNRTGELQLPHGHRQRAHSELQHVLLRQPMLHELLSANPGSRYAMPLAHCAAYGTCTCPEADVKRVADGRTPVTGRHRAG